jgi:hypothetical protein
MNGRPYWEKVGYDQHYLHTRIIADEYLIRGVDSVIHVHGRARLR